MQHPCALTNDAVPVSFSCRLEGRAIPCADFAGTAALALQQAARRTSAEGPQPWPGGGDGKSSPPMKLRRSKSVR